MSRFAAKLQCPNPECLYADNPIGQSTCDRCQSPLTYRYLWAVGSAQLASGLFIDCRYIVVKPQIWLDTQPGLSQAPPELSQQALPYLHLHPYRLHLPELYGVCQIQTELAKTAPSLLLSNVPIDAAGQLQPLLETKWASASAARQLNWLWQILQLWQPLQAEGVASSLLVSENLHVEGWRLRLRELVVDSVAAESRQLQAPVFAVSAQHGQHLPQVAVMTPPASVSTVPLTAAFLAEQTTAPSLQDLAEVWRAWAETAQPTIRHQLRHLIEEMQSTSDSELPKIVDRLNHLLLEQATQLPLHIEVAGATTTGVQRSHNEDACYPASLEEKATLPHVGIVCDGIGGHEGGEVASQLASRSLRLQLRTWLAELTIQAEPLPPQIIAEQLTEIVRVVNNLIAAQNDLQKREQRQRMGTTLVMAVQPPQMLRTELATGNTHELYLVHVGDSRAYWLTANNCQRLTVDDDLAAREVRAGRSLYSQIVARPDAAALTQALGTREADLLRITVQRLVLDEDGILLLCSDGLSDHGLVEQHWEAVTQPVLQHRLALKTAVQEWINLANRHNGHDNASVVLMHCCLNSEPKWQPTQPKLAISSMTKGTTATSSMTTASTEPDLTESAKALLYEDEEAPQKAAVLPKRSKITQKSADGWVIAICAAALMFVLGALGVAIWREIALLGFSPASSLSQQRYPVKSSGNERQALESSQLRKT